MPKFTDAKGREWTLDITMLDAYRIDKSDFTEVYQQKFSFLEPAKQDFSAFFTNTPLIFAIVWVLVQPQAVAMFKSGKFPVDPEQDREGAENEFLDGLNGPAVKNGRETFWSALQDFFPDQQTVLSILRNQTSKAMEKIGRTAQLMEPDLEEHMNRKAEEISKKFKEDLKTL